VNASRASAKQNANVVAVADVKMTKANTFVLSLVALTSLVSAHTGNDAVDHNIITMYDLMFGISVIVMFGLVVYWLIKKLKGKLK